MENKIRGFNGEEDFPDHSMSYKSMGIFQMVMEFVTHKQKAFTTKIQSLGNEHT